MARRRASTFAMVVGDKVSKSLADFTGFSSLLFQWLTNCRRRQGRRRYMQKQGEDTRQPDTESLKQADPHGDRSMLQSFGYEQELSRSLGFFTSFGLAFSYTSPTVGAYTLFGLGLATGKLPLRIGRCAVLTWGEPLQVVGYFFGACL
jgi:hypothetical protein